MSGRTSLVFVIFLLLVSVWACERAVEPEFVCDDRLGCIDIAPAAPVKIGVLQALSGEVAGLGREQIRGIELALERHGSKILGHPLSLQVEDTGCTAEGGANAVLKIIADPQTVAILGTTCSGAAATAAHAASLAGLVMVSGNNSAPFLTSISGEKAPDWHDGYFRTAPNEDRAGRAAALYAYRQLNIRRAATINDGDIYTKGLAQGFAREFKKLGGSLVLDAAINKADSNMRPVLQAVAEAGAELLFFPLFQPEANHVLLQARTMTACKELLFMGGGALIEASFIEAVGGQARGMYFVGPGGFSSRAAVKLAARYRVKYQSKPAAMYYQSAFDAAEMLLAALETVARRQEDGTLHIGKADLRQALYETRDFAGVTGVLSCDEFGDCAAPRFNILRLDDPAAGVEGLQSNIMFSL